MISYSSRDRRSANLIHDELALRCFDVIQDVPSFNVGDRIQHRMKEAVEECDVFISVVTKNSLYLDQDDSRPRPALQEFKMAFERRRQSIGTPDELKIVPVSYGLGDRNEVAKLVRQKTGECIQSLWMRSPLKDKRALPQKEAASVADEVLQAYLARKEICRPVSVEVATRGIAPSKDGLVVNGTRLLGGNHRRVGSRANWRRFGKALESVVRRLEERRAKGRVNVRLSCHLSAAFAVGRFFHQASGWQPSFRSSNNELVPARTGANNELQGAVDRLSETGALVVDVDLIGRKAANDASRLVADMGTIGGRGSWTIEPNRDLASCDMAKWARWIGGAIQQANADYQPKEIHVVLSTPAVFAAALGHHMTAMEANIVLYEHGSGGYRQSLVLGKKLS